MASWHLSVSNKHIVKDHIVSKSSSLDTGTENIDRVSRLVNMAVHSCEHRLSDTGS